MSDDRLQLSDGNMFRYLSSELAELPERTDAPEPVGLLTAWEIETKRLAEKRARTQPA